MEPQEGDIADLPDGREAVFQGGQWRVMQGQSSGGAWNIQPMRTPADVRAEETAQRSMQREDVTQARQGVSSETDLRKEFLSSPDVRDFALVRASYENVKATARNESAAGDLSLIFAFMKMLDPNSVVREQEFANAQNAASVPDQVRNLYNRALSGERLNPNQRADFVNQANSLFQNRQARYNQLADWYTGLAESYGYAPERIVMPDPIAEQEAAQRLGPPALQPQRDAPAGAAPLDPAEIAAQPAPTSGPGSSRTEPFIITPETPRELLANLPKGLWIQTTDAQGQTSVNRLAARAYSTDNPADRGEMLPGGNAALYTPGIRDTVRAATTAIGEQVPFLDEAAVAAVAAATGEDFSTVRDRYQTMQAIDNQTNRTARIAGGIAGAGLTLAAPGAAATGRFVANAPNMLGAASRAAGVGAGAGAVYGAASGEGGLSERIDDAQRGAVVGGLTAGALGAGGRGIGNLMTSSAPQASKRAGQVSMLRESGVPLTLGQRVGGPLMTAENIAMRAPILGPAIRGMRQRGQEGLNRAVGLRALSNIDQGIPAEIPAGGEMVGYVQDRLGQQFERAYSMVPEFVPDDQLTQGLARIGQAKSDLTPDTAAQFDNILRARLARLGTNPSGADVGRVRSEISNLAAQSSRAPDPSQQRLGQMLGEVADELDAAVSRVSPEAGGILSQAREGYSDYIRMERASTAAGGRPFSPGQLETAVKASDNTVRRGAVGRNEARMQDLSVAARTVMPDQFGNPGTADAVSGMALGAGAVGAPLAAAAVAGGLAAAATPYFLMGRKVLERLPANPSREALEAAEGELRSLARVDPNVIQLTDELRRAYQASGAVAGGNDPRERLMTQGTQRQAMQPR